MGGHVITSKATAFAISLLVVTLEQKHQKQTVEFRRGRAAAKRALATAAPDWFWRRRRGSAEIWLDASIPGGTPLVVSSIRLVCAADDLV